MRMSSCASSVLLSSVFAGIGVSTVSSPVLARNKPQPPNIVFILIDDMRWDTMSCARHPFVKTPNIDRIAASGVRFSNAFVTTSLCSPARASFLTGVYAHTHGVRTNERIDPDPSLPTFPQLLQKAGYETAFVGKWHMKATAQPRPGFDYWLSFVGQGKYIDPPLNENGRDFKAKGYMTDLLTGYAVNFLKRSGNKPFCLYLSHKAVHGPFTPADRHKNLYADLDLPEPVSHRDTLADKPKWMRTVFVRGQRQGQIDKSKPVPDALPPAKWQPRPTQWLNWFRALAAVDESVGQVLDTLRQIGAADNTWVIFASDNGYFLGEHRRGDKRLAFEESIRIPLLVCGPGIARTQSVLDQMALNIDVAPTLLELAGIDVPKHVQGRSLVPLLAGQSPEWRDCFLYTYFQERWLPGIPTMVGVRTNDWKYVRYPLIDDLDELYDLENDPHEMKNLSRDPSAARQRAAMRNKLDQLIQETGYTPKAIFKPVIRPGKLVLHYDFDNDGAAIVDRSGKGHDARIRLLARVAGRAGKALRCDGQGKIEIKSSPLLDPSNKPWTVAVWIKPIKRTGVILARGGQSNGYALSLKEGRLVWSVRIAGELIDVTSRRAIDHDWVHVTGTITGTSEIQLFINGKRSASAKTDALIPSDPNEPMHLGGDGGSQVNQDRPGGFVGLLDDLKIFDGQLVPADIAALPLH